ncbi:TRAP transporter small permease [Roseitranquillus sediminis]|uniref:TRAP transporter small permease n=1 Tax=Roseitranquillus sediminis TaxID=2809051 RepID=UPI001D0C39DD|nr:TRAP transporter small permease [Roseitranquillus sediminis]MBM9593887.1 TRAP transporter small permease [Roseitranquillus sediminis]
MIRILTLVENVLMAGCLLAALAIGTMQVVLRYVFNTGFVWSELALVTLTILAAMAGGSRAAADNIHVRITALVELLPAGGQRLCNVLALLFALIYSAFMAYAGYLYVEFVRMTGHVAVEANFPSWIIFSIGPLAMILFGLRYIQRLPRAWRDEDIGRTEFTD